MHREQKRILIQVALFIATFITTTLAGTEWAYSRSVYMEGYSWEDFKHGLGFSMPLLLILTVHEFGHYFMAMYHKVKASLPYYIPFPPIPFFPNLRINVREPQACVKDQREEKSARDQTVLSITEQSIRYMSSIELTDRQKIQTGKKKRDIACHKNGIVHHLMRVGNPRWIGHCLFKDPEEKI